MAALPAAVAAVRTAVRAALADLPRGEGSPLALVACSGGPDSLALAAATWFVAPRLGWRAGLVTVDHGLQPGSGERAEAVAAWAKEIGLAPVEVVPVRVAGRRGGQMMPRRRTTRPAARPRAATTPRDGAATTMRCGRERVTRPTIWTGLHDVHRSPTPVGVSFSDPAPGRPPAGPGATVSAHLPRRSPH